MGANRNVGGHRTLIHRIIVIGGRAGNGETVFKAILCGKCSTTVNGCRTIMVSVMHIRPIAIAAAETNFIDIVIPLPHNAHGEFFGVVIIDSRRVNNIRRHTGGIVFCLTAVSISGINAQSPVGRCVLLTKGRYTILIIT